MKQPKWIDSIDAIDHWEPGYWKQRGWDRSPLPPHTPMAVHLVAARATAPIPTFTWGDKATETS